MQLTSELKKEHQIIRGMFDKIDQTSDLENKKTTIKKLVLIATNHLSKENEQLYPVLQKSTNEEIKKIGDIFSDQMKKYADEFINITHKIIVYDQPSLNPNLIKAYEKSRDRIKDRVTIEETILFPAYENAMKINT